MSDQITYTIAGDARLRHGPKHLVGTRAWKMQGCRLVEDVKPVSVEPIEPAEAPDEVAEAPAVRRGRKPKTEADADQA